MDRKVPIDKREPVTSSHILTDGRTLVSVYATFALLQIHRVSWKIPVNDGVAVLITIGARKRLNRPTTVDS
jgi:hypothetical protein